MVSVSPLLIFIFLLILTARASSPSAAAAGWMDLNWDFIGEEHNLKVTGSIPSWLKGSLYRNGPGIWRFGDDASNPHWFEGLGFLRAFHFDGTTQNVSFYCSFINSSEYNQYDPYSNYTQKLTSPNSQVTIRRVNGNDLISNDGNPKSNSFDPITTKTLQHPYIYDDEYMADPYFNEACPSHAQTAPNGEIFHFLYVFGDGTADNPGYYQLYHIKPNTNKRIAAPNKIYPNKNINQPMFQHMHGLTEHYVILCEVPYNLLNGTWMPSFGVTWYVVDKYTADLVATFYSDDFMYYHWANSFEFINETTGELNIAVDIIIDVNGTVYDALYINNLIYNWPWSIELFCTGNLTRFILPLNQTGKHIGNGIKINEYSGVEMPVIYYDKYNTKPYQYVYQVAVKNCNVNDQDASQFWDSLMKTKVTFDGSGETLVWSAPNIYVNEPIFVPKPDGDKEDDGILLAEAIDSTTNSSFLLMLDAVNMEEIARVKPSVIKTIPFGFHGRFYADL